VVIVLPLVMLYLAQLFGPVVGRVINVIASNALAVYVMTDSIILMRNTDVKKSLKILWKSCRIYKRKVIHKKPSSISERKVDSIITATTSV